MSPAARGATPPDREGTAPLAWFWGDDAWSIERAAGAFAARIAGGGEPLETWRSPGEEEAGEGAETGGVVRRRQRVVEEAAARLGTAPLFGGGTLVVIRQPGWIAREAGGKARLLGLIGSVAPGNALCFTELASADGRTPISTDELRAAVAEAGGTVRRLAAPTRERMVGWLEARADELGVRLGPGAAGLLAERVGAAVREADVDRRRMSELANSELEKLALYRPGGAVTRDDVAELVSEAIPGSAWAYLDAVGARRVGEASRLAERLVADGTPLPVLTSQLHRRLRELILVREHLDAGTRAPELVRQLRLQPFRAQKLSEQAACWTLDELETALEGLVELDLGSKGISTDGRTVQMSSERDALGLQLLLAEHVLRR